MGLSVFGGIPSPLLSSPGAGRDAGASTRLPSPRNDGEALARQFASPYDYSGRSTISRLYPASLRYSMIRSARLCAPFIPP